MTLDSTLLFAARRNVPVRYNRDLVAKTLEAMKRIAEIRARRERVFYKKRMAGKRAREMEDARKLVANNEHLLPRLRGSEKYRLDNMALESGVHAEEPSAVRASEKSKALGGKMQRLRLRVDGGVEAVTERANGT
jgi:large subunit ribosomal protein L24e